MFGTISVHPVLRVLRVFSLQSLQSTSCFDECPMETTVFSARSLRKDKPEWFPLCVCSIGDVLSSQRTPMLLAIIKCLPRFPEKKYRTWVCPKFHGVYLQTGRKWRRTSENPGPGAPFSMALLNTPGTEIPSPSCEERKMSIEDPASGEQCEN